MIIGEQSPLAIRKRRAGQRLLIGFAGPTVDADLRQLAAELQPAGFIHFRRNVVDPVQVRELNRELAELVKHPAILAIDQEGGRVQRVREPATRWPSMRQVGQADPHCERTPALSTAIAHELSAMGFNLNFAPVADVDSNPDNPIIGDRSFGPDPHRVAHHVAAFVRAHQAAGVIACAKHFPGHGDTTLDSHLALPRVDRSLALLEAVERVPFEAAVAADVGAVMTAHVVFSALDAQPATLSATVIPNWLRQQLGFDGAVLSDDMEMKAVYGRYSTQEQVRKATEASVDALLCCEAPDVQLDMFQELVRAQEDLPSQEQAAERAVARVEALRQRFVGSRPADFSLVGCDAHQRLAEQLRGPMA